LDILKNSEQLALDETLPNFIQRKHPKKEREKEFRVCLLIDPTFR
jgi:hypothetical protein